MNVGQSKSASLLEAVTNIVAGATVALVAQEVIFPWYGLHPSTSENLQMVGLFTMVSLVRSFVLRRMFNWFTTKL